MNSPDTKHIQESDNIDEMYNFIHNHCKSSVENYRGKFRETKFDTNTSTMGQNRAELDMDLCAFITLNNLPYIKSNSK